MNSISNAERAKIQQEAQEILKKFSTVLAKVKIVKKEKKKQAGGWREEGQEMKDVGDFRERMLANAPQHDKDAIIAEKKQWQ